MKTKLPLTLLLSFSFYLLSSQVPQGFNYQAIVRDASNQIIAGQSMTITIGLYANSEAGSLLWEETHPVTSDQFGMVTLVVGKGTRSGGSATLFSDIDWNAQLVFLKTSVEYPVGTTTVMGSSQIWSVPYALRAKDSDQWLTSGANIYRATGNVGIGTTTPTRKLDVRGVIKGVTLSGAGATTGQFQSWTEGGAPGQRAVYSFYPTFEATPGGYFPRRAADIVGGFNGGNWATEFLSFNVGSNGSANDVENLTSEKIRITSSGNVGIGTTTPSYRLDVKGRIRTRSDGSAVSGLVFTNLAGDQNRGLVGMYNDDYISFYGSGGAGWGMVWNVNNGNLGIGTTNPTSKFVVQPDASWDDNTPLFEVKNKYGVAVLAVYNNGVKINVEHDPDGVKGVKGGFNIGGYDYTKGGTYTLMNITPDSIRFNINNSPAKGPKGGFAIGGFGVTKGDINENFMYITPQTSGNGQYNTFLGYQAGDSSSTANDNVMIGYNAGYYNSTGSQNVFIGKNAGLYNRSGDKNVILGWSDYVAHPFLDPGDLGSGNTLIGYSSGLRAAGDENTTLGYLAGKSLVNGINNTLIGSKAGYEITNGKSNVFVGFEAGKYNASGEENVFIGGAAGWNHTAGSNNIAIGTDAQVFSATGSNQIRMGDTRITYAEIQVAWTVPSDMKWKESVEDLAFGLDLIKGLKPVDYIRKNNSSGTREAGFIAQDVQKLFNEMGINNSGLLSVGTDGSLALRYNDFIPILTKAIQEQQEQIESQNQKIEQLEKIVIEMRDKIASTSR
jgi:hypothetical protein